MNPTDPIDTYFPELSPVQRERFSKLGALYTEWNARINVISRQDIDELYTRHVLHSLAIAKFIRFTPGSSLVDVGCGGGFPGIPLAIQFPEVHFTLVDSIGKKIRVVNEIASALELTNTTALQERAEKLGQTFDFVLSRAVTEFPRFVALTRKLVSKQQRNALPNGILYLKGGDFDNELAPFRKTAQVQRISDYFDEPFFETKKIIYLPVSG
ncbi:MAG TPA: 16S rRNA (guanine(527)-N(7))-methyltransferase RsmG [Prolixibacteraceae bacterium]|nr:16S rRNA (guanine(527)-N(7))-methyltransferase RsmG [Prolixibacteraceae bacterium]